MSPLPLIAGEISNESTEPHSGLFNVSYKIKTKSSPQDVNETMCINKIINLLITIPPLMKYPLCKLYMR